MAKVHLLHQDNLISATEKASASKFPQRETPEFYSLKQSAQYNDKMNSCRALENLLQSHNAGGMSMQMRCEFNGHSTEAGCSGSTGSIADGYCGVYGG